MQKRNGSWNRAWAWIGLAMLSCFASGCAERWQTVFVTDARADLPPWSYTDVRGDYAGSEPQWLEVYAGGAQTVLVASWSTTEPDAIDEFDNRTYVIVLDGPPAEGEYQVTPENGRFLPGTNWYPPRVPYEGLEGTITLESVAPDQIVAYCGLRNVLKKPTDTLYPLRGTFTFKRLWAGKQRTGAVRWIER